MLCQALGWTWDEVLEQMDLPRFQALMRHWDEYPPVHVSLATYVRARAGKGRSRVPAATEQRELPGAQSAGAILDSLMEGPDG